MNAITAASMTDPFGRVSECIQFAIDDPNVPFTLKDIMTIGQQYTFSLWLLSETSGSVSVSGQPFDSTNAWNRRVITFTADSTDLCIYFNELGIYYVFHPQLEIGNKATDWTPAPEDMATADEMDAVNSGLVTIKESVAKLTVEANEISSSVTAVETRLNESIGSVDSRVETLTQEVSAKMTAEAVEFQIDAALENGATKIVTKTGYTFDEDGMTVQKSGSEMKTQITENGMTVFQNDEAVLTANNTGVDAKNLHATTYLIVGKNSRFEDFGENRTGCFWIGG